MISVVQLVQNLHIRIWQLTAIVPYKSNKSWKIVLHQAAGNGFAVLSMLFWTLTLYSLLFEDINEKTFTATIFLMMILVTVKYLLFRCQADRLNNTVEIVLLIEKLTSATDNYEHSMLKKGVKFIKVIAIANIGMCTSAVAMMFLNTLFKDKRQLIVETKLPSWIDWENRDSVFALCLLGQTIIAMYFMILTTTLDFYGPNLFIFLDCFLAILDRRIRNIGWTLETMCGDSFQYELLKCLQFHKLCLRYEYVVCYK